MVELSRYVDCVTFDLGVYTDCPILTEPAELLTVVHLLVEGLHIGVV